MKLASKMVRSVKEFASFACFSSRQMLQHLFTGLIIIEKSKSSNNKLNASDKDFGSLK
jgi:hypothetical protein